MIKKFIVNLNCRRIALLLNRMKMVPSLIILDCIRHQILIHLLFSLNNNRKDISSSLKAAIREQCVILDWLSLWCSPHFLFLLHSNQFSSLLITTATTSTMILWLVSGSARYFLKLIELFHLE